MGPYKWIIVAAGAILFLLGTGFKVYNMSEYNEAFTQGNSYIGIAVGIIAIALGLTFDWLTAEDEQAEE